MGQVPLTRFPGPVLLTVQLEDPVARRQQAAQTGAVLCARGGRVRTVTVSVAVHSHSLALTPVYNDLH